MLSRLRKLIQTLLSHIVDNCVVFFASLTMVRTGPSWQPSSTNSLSMVFPERRPPALHCVPRWSVLRISWKCFSFIFPQRLLFFKPQADQLCKTLKSLFQKQPAHQSLHACSGTVICHSSVFCHGNGFGIAPPFIDRVLLRA